MRNPLQELLGLNITAIQVFIGLDDVATLRGELGDRILDFVQSMLFTLRPHALKIVL